jgi:hypothetical protein
VDFTLRGHNQSLVRNLFYLSFTSLFSLRRVCSGFHVKVLITNNAFCIAQRARAQSKTGVFRDYSVAEAPPGFMIRGQVKNLIIKIKIRGSECQTSGTCAKRAEQATKKDNAAACLCFLNYLAFLRPAADRAVFKLPRVVRRGRLYGFLWAGSII